MKIALVCIIEDNFQIQAPGAYIRGAYYGRYFCVSDLGGLYTDGLIHRGAYFRNFTVWKLTFRALALLVVFKSPGLSSAYIKGKIVQFSLSMSCQNIPHFHATQLTDFSNKKTVRPTTSH